jgi:hypothetical protein
MLAFALPALAARGSIVNQEEAFILTKRLVALVVPLFLIGCLTYNVPGPRSGSPPAADQSSIYVSLPEDGKDDRPKTYVDSGSWTLSAIETALLDAGVAVKTGSQPETVEAALLSAQEAEAEILVYPEISNWEDRATEWSGKPDRIGLRMRLFDAKSGTVLDDQVIDAKSRWATLGGDHPQDLLPGLISEWVASIR